MFTNIISGPITINPAAILGAVVVTLPTGDQVRIANADWRTVASRLVDPVSPAPVRYGHCTVNYHGRPADARKAEQLPNGYWRVDFVSGLVGCYDEDPVANTDARQRH